MGDGDLVGGEVELVGEHGWVKILGSVRHEVEAGHEENQVDELEPVALQCDLSFSDESLAKVSIGVSDSNTLVELSGLTEAETKGNDEDWWAGTEPEEWTPTVRGGADETTRESSGQKVTKGISLLEHTRDQTTSSIWAVLEGSGSSVSVKSSHGNTEKGTASKELWVCLGETSTELKDDEENVVGDERPLASISVSSDTEDDGTNRTKHKNQGDTPSNVGIGLVESGGERSDGERNGEEVKGIPCPGEESDEEESPLTSVEHAKKGDWVWSLVHWWLEG